MSANDDQKADQDPKVKDVTEAPASGDAHTSQPRNPARRRLATAGLGGALLVSLPAKSVWGAGGERCSLSGNIFSANVSNIEHDCSGSAGCTPGFWMNNWNAWGCTGYSPGSCTEWNPSGKKCQDFDATVGTGGASSFSGVFGYAPECLGGSASLMEVLQASGQCSGSLDWHAVGAVLNAACGSVDFGASVDDVVKAYSMAREDAEKYGAVKEVFTNMNEQGCPIDSQGD